MEINEQHAALIAKRGLESKDKSDRVILVSGIDGQRISIHRFILSAASKYFADLVLESDSDIKQQEFVLADSDGETIKTVVDYCYSGNIVLTEQNAAKCLQVAAEKSFDSLLEKCQEYFSSKLSVENAVQVLTIADENNIDDLRQRALELIGSQTDKVLVTDIVQLKHSMMQRLLENGKANDMLVERLIKWFQHDEDGRGEYMPKMLRLIRLDQLTVQFLNEIIEPIFVRFECFDLAVAEYERRAAQCVCTTSSNNRPPSPVNNVEPESAPPETELSSQMENVDMKSIFIVCVTEPPETEIAVDMYDKSINRFTRHFTSPAMDAIDFGTVLYANKLFVIGGRHGETLDSMIAFDLTTGKKEILASMNEPRRDFTSIVMGKWIYVFGGRKNSVLYSSSCERYDTETNKWEKIKSMNHTRGTVSAAILNGVIYVASRSDSLNTTLLESYDPKTNKWTVRKTLIVGRYWSQDVSLLFVFNGILYFFFGSGFRRYDPEQDKLSKTIGRLFLRDVARLTLDIQEIVAVDDRLFGIAHDKTLQQLTIDENEMEMDIEEVATVPVLPGSISIHRMG